MSASRKIVMVVFDGLRPDMVTPGRMPQLRAFLDEARWYREARSVFPSMTRVATSSIATGAMPVAHGIVGNAFYYPEVSRDFVLDVSRADDVALAEQVLGGGFITAPTFADVLAARGKRVAVVHTGSAGSTYAINPRAAENGHWTFSIHGEEATRTPGAVRDAIARIGPLPPRNLPRFEEIDYGEKLLSEYVLPEIDPDVAVIWFNEPDTSYHYRFLGSAETTAVMRHADEAFGRILDAIDARPDADAFTVIVASDHGQISSSGEVDVGVLLSEAGHPAAKASRRDLNGAALAITGGNMGEIRVLDGDIRRRDRVARWLMEQDFTGMVFTPSEDSVFGEVEGTFSTRLVGLDHARQPELVYVLRSGLEADQHGLPGLGLITGSVPVGGGMHGGLNRHELNTVLALRGEGISPGMPDMPAGIIDIAPTILGILGVPVPPGMRGMNLASRPLPLDVREIEYRNGVSGFNQSLSLRIRDGHAFFDHGGRLES